MAGAKIVQFDYFDFLRVFRRATNAGCRIEPSETDRWQAYIKENGLNEVSAAAIARQQFPSAVPVIIDEGEDTDGLYFYAGEEEACLRLVSIKPKK